MKAEHTPWQQGYSDDFGPEYIVVAGEPMAVVRWGCGCCADSGPLKQKEQAAIDLIIRAVNSHMQLLEALKALVAGVDRKDNPVDEGLATWSVEMDAARAAIDRAEGK